VVGGQGAVLNLSLRQIALGILLVALPSVFQQNISLARECHFGYLVTNYESLRTRVFSA